MADGINRVTLLGNLRADPELRATSKTSQSVCNFIVVTNTSHGKSSKRHDVSEGHSIVAWGRLAELCAEHIQSGSKVYVEGYLHTKKWEDKRGQDRTTTEIIAKTVIFLDRRENAC